MAESVFKERVFETTTSTGTGDITLIGAKVGYQSFNSAYGTSVSFPYLVEDLSTGDWESGITTLSDATTLVRDGSQTVVASSNSGSAVNFAAGVKNVVSAANTRHISQFTQLHNGNRIAAIGSSMTQLNNVATSSGRITWSIRGPLSWLQAYAGDAVDIPVWHDDTVYSGWEPSAVPGATRYFQGLNFGVSGSTLPLMINRLEFIDEHYIDSFDLILIEGGTNDAGGSTVDTMLANAQQLCEFFLARGKTVALMSVLARDLASWGATSTPRKRWNALNRAYKEYCRGRRNLIFLDWNEFWCDKTNANGIPRISSDGVHWDPISAERVGGWLYDQLQVYLPPKMPRVVSQDDVYDATYNLTGNLLTNPFLLGTSGTTGAGASGVVATGMVLERDSSSTGSSCSVVGSVEARPDLAGNYQVCTFTMAGSDEEQYNFRTSPVNTAHALAEQWVIASCEIETNDSDMIQAITVTIDDQGTDGLIAQSMFYYANSGKMPIEGVARKILCKTPPILLVSDSVNIRFRVEMHVKNSGSIAPVIKIGSLELRKCDDPRPESLYA